MTTETLEKRVETLEEQVASLLGEKSARNATVPWWKKHFGAFKDSPYYEEAMKLGAEYRRSQPTDADECDDDVSA